MAAQRAEHVLFRRGRDRAERPPAQAAADAAGKARPSLRRVLRASALRNEAVDYARALNSLAEALLLLCVDEEHCFGLPCAPCERLCCQTLLLAAHAGARRGPRELLLLLGARLPAVRRAR